MNTQCNKSFYVAAKEVNGDYVYLLTKIAIVQGKPRVIKHTTTNSLRMADQYAKRETAESSIEKLGKLTEGFKPYEVVIHPQVK